MIRSSTWVPMNMESRVLGDVDAAVGCALVEPNAEQKFAQLDVKGSRAVLAAIEATQQEEHLVVSCHNLGILEVLDEHLLVLLELAIRER